MSDAALAPTTRPAALPGARVGVFADLAVGAAALVVIASLAVVVIGHIGDRYRLNFVSGVYAALAERFNDGVFYPALFDGESYAGTRYMPLSFVPHALAARLTGEYVLSGKAITLALSAVLLVQLFCILRGLGCGRSVSLALASLALVTQSGFLACTTIRGDLLPVVLQLAALQLVCGGATGPRAAAAGVFCTLALLTKVTAAWAPLALGAFLLVKHRRVGLVFLAAWLGTLAVALAGLYVGTSGRILDNFRAVSVGGVLGLGTVLKSPVAFLARVGRGGAAEALLCPLALLECVLAARQRRFTLYHSALLFTLPILLAIFTDVGADYNHLLDLMVLAVPVAGSLWASLSRPGRRALAGPRAGLALAACWALFMCWTALLGDPAREVVQAHFNGDKPRFPAKPLAGLVADDAKLLTEDPWVAVTRGRAPCVLDPCSFAVMGRTHPELTDRLVRRIDAAEFDRIVLRRHDADGEGREDEEWQDRIFGPKVIGAVHRRYLPTARAEGYDVWAPKSRDDRASSGDDDAAGS
jgi:hypothetical protein